MTRDQIGAIIENGPSDWQILQQDDTGTTGFQLAGSWIGEAGGEVQVRLVLEATGQPVRQHLDWQTVATSSDGAWCGELSQIPAGGLYRLETRYNPKGNLAGEWSSRGDVRHFLGVGDLWLIAGQSNSAGYGKGPVYDPPELGVHVLGNNERWALACHPLNDSTDTQHPVNREAANSAHSPYLHFGRLLKQQLGYPIGLIQTALGGSALAPWNPTETHSAALYHNMLHCATLAGGHIKGILWYQGESDATADLAPTYADRFGRAVQAWRDALGSPDLPVITVQLNRYYTPSTDDLEAGWSLLREAQRQVALRTAGVTVVPTLDLPLGDLIHTSAQGNMLLAERMAQTALGAVYGREVAYRAPEIRAAQYQVENNGVVLTFAPVTSRMDNPDLTSCCFTVRDILGTVPVRQITYPGNDTVCLVLERSIQGAAYVDGAPGLNPPPAPMDMERFMPMLAFYGFPMNS
ncbi:MAG: sialate O-acetylesterase [Anaerolineae bacterium]